MALRQINMIPANRLARADLVRHLWFWGKGLIFILLALIMGYLVQASRFSLQQKAQDSDASLKQTVMDQIARVRKDSDTINVQMKDLALKSGLLATLTSQQPFYDILAVFAESFNEGTWIDHLSLQRGNKKDIDQSNFMVDGFSMNHNTLGVFLESLSTNSRIQDVVLVYAKKQEQSLEAQDSFNVIQFRLTCAIIKGSP